ncbi:hypothetical protein SO078_25970 (plasmid) [Sinorhizobium meliloti]|nr:hypothetical protein [Sinorhizobium meliloti]WRQ71593.1 hypothetical protein SO078_25970 [Sinorhizobium meliloti]
MAAARQGQRGIAPYGGLLEATMDRTTKAIIAVGIFGLMIVAFAML